MLTLKQINEVSFRKSSFSGYKPEDVDDFIDDVSETFTAILKENQALKAKNQELTDKNTEIKEKLTVLAEKIESYRDDEEDIKNALLSAQKLGAASVKEAKSKAASIISDANVKAESIIQDAKNKSTVIVAGYDTKIAAKQKEFDTLKSSVTSFRSSLFEMYKNHLNAIESIPDFSAELAKKAKAENEKEDEQTKVIPETKTVEQESAKTPKQQAEPVEQTQINNDIQNSAEQYIPDDVTIDKLASENAVNIADDAAAKDDGIDLNAYADIPESLKKEKESLYSTLEFGDDIDLKK
jgi:cell division initiation protein